MSQLVTAIAGGAVGSIFTVAIRYAAVPSEVRHNDRQIIDIDRDLDRFAADEYARLRNELPKLLGGQRLERFTATSDRSKGLAREMSLAISWSMQLYRDHENAQLTIYRELMASEKWLHWVYRQLDPRHKPIAKLTTPERATVFLDRWRTLTVSSGEKLHMPDPRKRSIEAATQLLDQEQRPSVDRL
jgi:hypothetical protein